MEILTFGNCCSKSKKNHENAVSAAKQCGVAEPKNIGDYKEMAKYGVMSTPALAIDGKVVAAGRALTEEQIVEFINARK